VCLCSYCVFQAIHSICPSNSKYTGCWLAPALIKQKKGQPSRDGVLFTSMLNTCILSVSQSSVCKRRPSRRLSGQHAAGGVKQLGNVCSHCIYKSIKLSSICGGIWMCVGSQMEKRAKCVREHVSNKPLLQRSHACFPPQFFILLPSPVLAREPAPDLFGREVWLFC